MPTIVKNKFSPSVNILRDKGVAFEYTQTRNSSLSVNTILNNYRSGVRSFILIGAYGTGKSSFLLALSQALSKKIQHFSEFKKQFGVLPEFDFIDIVGEYSSLEKCFSKLLDEKQNLTADLIIEALEAKRKNLAKKKKGLAIVIDEFGKFLEYAAKNNPESELYFVQQLAEWANNADNDVLFISTLHQDFSAYSLHLNRTQRLEWDKVKGRLKEIPFNEPVEQLLLLAANRIEKKFKTFSSNKDFDKLYQIIEQSKVFPFRNYFDRTLAQKLYPFDILSGAILTLSLQKYGQNERSLFSFIDSNDELAIGSFKQLNKPYYSIPTIYDYLLSNYHSYILSKYNTHYSQWASIRRAIEKIDGLFSDNNDHAHAEELIKVIGLLNIFSSATAKLDPSFYISYARYALGVTNSEDLIEVLEKRKIIRYVKHSVKYILFEGTDLDIELAIDDAGRIVEKVSNIVQQLSQLFEFPFVSAKSNVYQTGTPRYFQFKLTESPIQSTPEGEIDGFVNLVFSEGESSRKDVIEVSKNCKEAILFGYFKNTAEIKNLLFEIQKIAKVKELNSEDIVAVRELTSIQSHYIKLLNHHVLDNIYSGNGSIDWYHLGVGVDIPNRSRFIQRLSKICNQVYPATPHFKNEMVNRTKVSSQISYARRKLFDRLVNNIDQKNLGFTENEFPPEKSIYLSLLLKTGIHSVRNGVGKLSKPSDESYITLWEAGQAFIDSTKNKERKLTELIEVFSTKPFKLKDGFIDFWLPIFLLANSHEFALYESQVYIPELNTDILELITKKPSLFTIKAFDVAGVKFELFNKYRQFLNQGSDNKITNQSFIDTIKPFLVFYRDLPDFSKKTQRWLSPQSQAIRAVIANAKDPEKTFFEDFPVALGFNTQDFSDNPNLIPEFIQRLKSTIKELQGCHDKLFDHFENFFITEVLGLKAQFPDYKKSIQLRFKGLKTHLLLPAHKTFTTRLFSELEDRKAWLSAISQSLVSKSLNAISDSEVDLLYQNLQEVLLALDNLCELGSFDDLADSEDVVKLELISLRKGLLKQVIRFPKSKHTEVNKRISAIKSGLSKDKKENLFILTKILQDLLESDEK
ncbi:MAG: hypothetical protein FJX80_02695 [Bacteroidetes bacterium]|nr:hypothetical protein [Bacteroidota bacterium]